MTIIALTIMAVFAFGVWLVRLRHPFLGTGVVFFGLFFVSMWVLLPTEPGDSGILVFDAGFATPYQAGGVDRTADTVHVSEGGIPEREILPGTPDSW